MNNRISEEKKDRLEETFFEWHEETLDEREQEIVNHYEYDKSLKVVAFSTGNEEHGISQEKVDDLRDRVQEIDSGVRIRRYSGPKPNLQHQHQSQV